MKRLNVIAGMLLAVVLIGASAYAHTLNGIYGGQADGVDVNGAQLHQITKWTFNSGKLVAFQEFISFGGIAGGGAGSPPVGTTVCEFDASGDLPYSLETNLFVSFVALGFGCPNPSTNNRPEAILIIPENDGKEFSYLEHTAPSDVFDQDVPAHFSGHAVTQAALP